MRVRRISFLHRNKLKELKFDQARNRILIYHSSVFIAPQQQTNLYLFHHILLSSSCVSCNITNTNLQLSLSGSCPIQRRLVQLKSMIAEQEQRDKLPHYGLETSVLFSSSISYTYVLTFSYFNQTDCHYCSFSTNHHTCWLASARASIDVWSRSFELLVKHWHCIGIALALH